MGQASKYLLRIIGLGLVGAIATAAGCALQQMPNTHAAVVSTSTAGVFFFMIGLLLFLGAVVIMVVWAVRSVRS